MLAELHPSVLQAQTSVLYSSRSGITVGVGLLVPLSLVSTASDHPGVSTDILIDFSAEVNLAISWTVFEESICLGLSGTIRIYRSILIIEGVIAMNLVVRVTLMALDAGTCINEAQ